MDAKNEDLKNGQVNISTDVLTIITSIAAREVEGTQDASSGIVDELSSLFNKKNYSKGIKIEVQGDNVTIDISINVEYGYNVHKVAEAVQKKVTEKVEGMTELNVTAVNVNVANVFLKEEVEEKKKKRELKKKELQEKEVSEEAEEILETDEVKE